MKVKLLISRATALKAYAVGEVIDVSEREAQRLVAAGKAVIEDVMPKRETTRKRRVSEKRGE